jgi:hypothetical protein
MRAILFSIVTFEINYNAYEYTEDKLTIMKEYESKSWNEKTTHYDNIIILELLAEHKNID